MSNSNTTMAEEPKKLVKRLFNLAGLAGLAKRPKPALAPTPCDVVHEENKWKLLRYRPRPAAQGGVRYAKPVLLIPSLINRHYVLDLMPGKSFAEWLVARGHDVFVIDWGTPGAEDRYLSFDQVCHAYLGRAVRKAAKLAKSDDVHLFGYCLGGTLATIYAAREPAQVASLVNVAAPIDFDDDGLLAHWTKRPEFNVGAILGAFGNVPWPLMQATFHLLRPTLNLAKGVYLLERAWDDEFLDGFVALETWGNDNVSFPGEAFRKYIEDLYQKNALIKGELSIAGERVDLQNLRCPLLCISFEHDNIVPAKGAQAIMPLVGSNEKELVHLPGGHVGAVVSKSAAKGLWPKMADFWAAHDTRAAATRQSKPRAARAEA